MKSKEVFRPLFIFYILVAYIFIQFCWWAFHIVSLNQEILRLKSEIPAYSTAPAGSHNQIIDGTLGKKIWMVVGEGSVFLILLTAGAIITRRAFRKEFGLANQQKNFLLSITHELKSPIASVKLFIETLIKRDLEKEKQKEILSNTLKETERLLSLVENILFSAKIESGNFKLYKELINISEFTSEISAIPSTRNSSQKSHRFTFHIEKDVYLFTDRNAYSSIMLNLIENAVKYSPSGSEILIELKKKNNAVLVSVADHGPGIHGEEKELIFKKFYRAGNEETRKTQGTGLGLFIVKYLVEKLGGTISVRNNVPHGSIFEMMFFSPDQK